MTKPFPVRKVYEESFEMEIRPSTFRTAKEFNTSHHRHNPDIQGCKFCLSCWAGEKLAGVAICGRPVSWHLKKEEELVKITKQYGGVVAASSVEL